MDFTSSLYIGFVTATVLASERLWRLPFSGQMRVALVANLVFLASFVQSVQQLAPLLGFLVLGYAATRWVARSRKPWVLGWTIALIVAAFVVLKRYTFLPARIELPFLYLQVGLSYILFRILQMVIDYQAAGGEDGAGSTRSGFSIPTSAIFSASCRALFIRSNEYLS